MKSKSEETEKIYSIFLHFKEDKRVVEITEIVATVGVGYYSYDGGRMSVYTTDFMYNRKGLEGVIVGYSKKADLKAKVKEIVKESNDWIDGEIAKLEVYREKSKNTVINKHKEDGKK